MARSSQNSRWRRVLMQLIMWMILGATVGLAEWICHDRQQSSRPQLVNAVPVGGMTITLPKKWSYVTSSGSLLLTAQEPRGPAGGRVLTLSRQKLRAAESPREFLDRSRLLTGTFTIGDDPEGQDDAVPAEGSSVPMQPMRIAGWPGVMARVQRPVASPMGLGMELHTELVGCAVLPSHVAIILQLNTPGAGDSGTDEDLLKRIAEQMTVSGEGAPQKQATISLANGLSLNVPEGFAVLPAADPNRTERVLMQEGLAIDVVPCVYFPGDSAEDVRTMLLLHTPYLAAANLKQQDDGIWRVEWPNGEETHSITGARLIPRADGNSILLIFMGAPVEGPEFGRAFSRLSNGIGGASLLDYSVLLKSGADETERLTGTGLSGLLGNAREQEWWLLQENGGKSHLGWVHLKPDETMEWGASRESRWMVDKRLVQMNESWEGLGNFKGYSYQMRRNESDAGDETNGNSDLTIEQRTRLANGQLATRIFTSDGENETPSGRVPAGYIPGGWLTSILGKLSDKPMVLRTEAFMSLANQGVPVGHPIKLVVSSGGPAKSIDDRKTALRCVTVEVSGTGMVSRWYYRPDGSLDSVSYADGVEQVRSDPAALKFEFASEPRMVP